MQAIKKISQNNTLFNRVFDIAFSSSVLVVFSPALIVIGGLIKIKSPGPVFFSHNRVGENGDTITVHKFRTMVPNAGEVLEQLLASDENARIEFERDFKLKDDPRVIPIVGEFLRKTSMDEIPQFFNVLMGDMSVVGPRPVTEAEIERYGQNADKVLSVKPGVTGLWQVSGRNDVSYDERVTLDMEYIEKKSLWLDIKIIFKTAQVVLLRTGY